MAQTPTILAADNVDANGGANDELLVEPPAAEAWEVNQIGLHADTEVYYETDPDGDGTFEGSTLIGTFSRPTFARKIWLDGGEGGTEPQSRLRLVNMDAAGQALSASGVKHT